MQNNNDTRNEIESIQSQQLVIIASHYCLTYRNYGISNGKVLNIKQGQFGQTAPVHFLIQALKIYL